MDPDSKEWKFISTTAEALRDHLQPISEKYSNMFVSEYGKTVAEISRDINACGSIVAKFSRPDVPKEEKNRHMIEFITCTYKLYHMPMSKELELCQKEGEKDFANACALAVRESSVYPQSVTSKYIRSLGPLWPAHQAAAAKASTVLKGRNYNSAIRGLWAVASSAGFHCPKDMEAFLKCGEDNNGNPYRCVPEAEKFTECTEQVTLKILKAQIPPPPPK